MYFNSPPEVDLPISQVEVEQASVTTPIPISIKVNRHLKEGRPLDKKIID